VFLKEMLPELLEEIPLSLKRNTWFQHDWAAADISRQVREHLTTTYKDRWIGRGGGGAVAWSPRSPDLTPLGFFLWGYIKTLIYSSPVDSEEDLLARIFEAAAIIRQKPGIFELARQFLLRRCWLCCSNICSRLVTNTTFSESFSVFLDFQP
jgi:hypothetical protein